MNLSFEAYKLAEASKPQSSLLQEWLEKCSFSDDEEIPQDLQDIFTKKQTSDPNANLIKIELEYWRLVRESRETAQEEELFRVAEARRSFPGYEVAGWSKKRLPLLHEDPRFKSADVKCFFEGRPVQNPVLLLKAQQSIIYTKIPELEEPFLWITKKSCTPKIDARLLNERKFALREVNSEFPYLFGKQYYNRLVRGTKVFIICGKLNMYHGMIVCHYSGFDINSKKPPLLKVLLANATHEPKVHVVSQHLVKIIDLKGIVGFAIPTKAPQSDSN